MSIFSKQLRNLTFDDIEQLKIENMSENIRLEFKAEPPSKDEMMKKISSFANTYGGFIVIGASDDGKGNLATLGGVDVISNYNQKIVQWSYDNLYPPITPEISNPITHRDNPKKVFYVIYIEESRETPHFINGRKGCYIRTDEFSQKFEPRLSTYEEIQHVSNRRQRAIELRQSLIERAQSRFAAHVDLNYQKTEDTVGDIDVTFTLSILPSFPRVTPMTNAELADALNSCQTPARGMSFPAGQIRSQHEGFFYDNPRVINFSYLEASIHRYIFYAQEMGKVNRESKTEKKDAYTPEEVKVYTPWILAQLIFYLRYSRKFYNHIGYDGSLYAQVGLDRIRGRQFLIPVDPKWSEYHHTSPMLDDNFFISREIRASKLQQDIWDVIKDIYRTLCFACGWSEAFFVSNEEIEKHIGWAFDYLSWPREKGLP